MCAFALLDTTFRVFELRVLNLQKALGDLAKRLAKNPYNFVTLCAVDACERPLKVGDVKYTSLQHCLAIDFILLAPNRL